MKAILMVIRPEWFIKILTGEKTIEVRKLFPKDYVGWVYLYCCKLLLQKYTITSYPISFNSFMGYPEHIPQQACNNIFLFSIFVCSI